jgi:hypothetical protein
VLGSGGIAQDYLNLSIRWRWGKWSSSCPSCLTPQERACSTHWIGGWVQTRGGLSEVKRQIPAPAWNQTLVFQLVAQRHTDWTILTPCLCCHQNTVFIMCSFISEFLTIWLDQRDTLSSLDSWRCAANEDVTKFFSKWSELNPEGWKGSQCYVMLFMNWFEFLFHKCNTNLSAGETE